MWGESSKNCEINCQCSGLITENFKINSGNNATKRKQDTALTHNFKTKMHPHSLDFNQSPISPNHTKRRILGEIHNLYTSPRTSYTQSPLKRLVSPSTSSPINDLKLNSPLLGDQIRNTPLKSVRTDMDLTGTPKETKVTSNTPLYGTPKHRTSPKEGQYCAVAKQTADRPSPLTSRTFRRTSKITRIFEERSQFKMSNKENCEMINETFVKLDVEEETRDCSFGEKFPRQKVENWSNTKMDFTNLQSTFESDSIKEAYVPENDNMGQFEEIDTLHDLEEEFDAENFDTCTKYEIISTDSPNIISRGRPSTSRKINSRDFVFGASLAENEPSTSFNRPNVTATRMLSFEEEDFEFPSPALKKSVSVKKSLKFNETPTKNPLRHEKSDSSIGSMTSSPPSSKLRLFTSESTASMESGFISELEEPFLDIEESSSPKMANFDDLLSGQIKNRIVSDVRRPLSRSLSFNPESKARVSLFSIKESPVDERKTQKRQEEQSCLEVASKRRKGDESSLEIFQRPKLQRAFSENNASIMSALARSATEPDLIGDFSLPFALPLTSGDHSDLKSISCDTLAALVRGEYEDSIEDFKVIDCRYPYEYEGGHILNALNLYTPEQISGLVNKPLKGREHESKRDILVFHCEFSLERGPKLFRFLRSSDREKNKENYPSLNYPEVYLLHEGYRSFYQKYPELCLPTGYTTMLDPEHRHLLRKHRSVSRSMSTTNQRKNRLLL